MGMFFQVQHTVALEFLYAVTGREFLKPVTNREDKFALHLRIVLEVLKQMLLIFPREKFAASRVLVLHLHLKLRRGNNVKLQEELAESAAVFRESRNRRNRVNSAQMFVAFRKARHPE